MENWKAIPGTNGKIEVSDMGRVRSLLRGEPYILKATADKKGYLRLRVTINREKFSYKVHREVAKAFILNPNNLPQVNHIDGNKANNAVSNLEWCTNKENAHHALRTGLWTQFKGVDIEHLDANKPKRNYHHGKVSTNNGAGRYNPNPPKPIIGHHDGENKCFDSIADAERYLDSRHIIDVLKGRRSHVKGWTFMYQKGGEMGANDSIRETAT